MGDLAKAAGVTGAISSTAGCATPDALYGDMVKDNIEEDIEGMGPEQAAEYFLNEQRSFDEVNETSGLIADEIHANYSEDGDSYSAEIVMPTNLTVVDSAEEAQAYQKATGNEFYDSIVSEAPEDTVAFFENQDGETFSATSEEELVRAMDYQLLEGAELPYRVFNGEGTDRPVARGEFIDNDQIREQLPDQMDEISVKVLAGDNTVAAEYTQEELEEVLEHGQELFKSDMDFVEGNVEIR